MDFVLLKMAIVFVFSLFFIDNVKVFFGYQTLKKHCQILVTSKLKFDILFVILTNWILLFGFLIGITNHELVNDLNLIEYLVVLTILNGIVAINLDLNLRQLRIGLQDDAISLINLVLYR